MAKVSCYTLGQFKVIVRLARFLSQPIKPFVSLVVTLNKVKGLDRQAGREGLCSSISSAGDWQIHTDDAAT